MYGLWSFTDWALVPETGPILRAAAPKSVGAAATKPAGGRRRILCAADGACARNEVDGRRELLWLTRRLAGSVGGVLGVIGRLPKWPERGEPVATSGSCRSPSGNFPFHSRKCAEAGRRLVWKGGARSGRLWKKESGRGTYPKGDFILSSRISIEITKQK